MLQSRAIPCLLLKDRGFVKTVRFQNPVYLGDPINIVRLFNDKEADELIVLDITATIKRRPPQYDVIATLTSECFMPLCYGGGVQTIEHMRTLFSLGIEKVSVNTAFIQDPELISRAADVFGSQAVVASIDVKSDWFGGNRVYTAGGRKNTGLDPTALAKDFERRGVGEILLNSVDRDGSMTGYDLDLIHEVSSAVNVPVIACGGAGTTKDLPAAIAAGASAAAAGSLFVYQGPHRAVLINYPSGQELRQLFADSDEL